MEASDAAVVRHNQEKHPLLASNNSVQAGASSENVYNTYSELNIFGTQPLGSEPISERKSDPSVNLTESVEDRTTFITCQISIKNDKPREKGIKTDDKDNTVADLNISYNLKSDYKCEAATSLQETFTSCGNRDKNVGSCSLKQTPKVQETHQEDLKYFQARSKTSTSNSHYYRGKEHSNSNESRSSSWERSKCNTFYPRSFSRRHSTTSISPERDRYSKYSRNHKRSSTSHSQKSLHYKGRRYSYDYADTKREDYSRSRSPNKSSHNFHPQQKNDQEISKSTGNSRFIRTDEIPSSESNKNINKETKSHQPEKASVIEITLSESDSESSVKKRGDSDEVFIVKVNSPSSSQSLNYKLKDYSVQEMEVDSHLTEERFTTSERPKNVQAVSDGLSAVHHNDQFNIPLLTEDCCVVNTVNPDEFYFPPLSAEKCSDKNSSLDSDFTIYPKTNETCDQIYDDRRDLSKYIDSFDIVGLSELNQNYKPISSGENLNNKTFDFPGYFTTEPEIKSAASYIPVRATTTEDLHPVQELFPSYDDIKSNRSEESTASDLAVSVIGTYAGSCLQDELSTLSVSSTSESSESSSETSDFDDLPLPAESTLSKQEKSGSSILQTSEATKINPSNTDSQYNENQISSYPCLSSSGASTKFKKIDLNVTASSLQMAIEANKEEKSELKPENCCPKEKMSTLKMRQLYVLNWHKKCHLHFQFNQSSEHHSSTSHARMTRKETNTPYSKPISQQSANKDPHPISNTASRVTHVTPWQAECTDVQELQDKVSHTYKQVPYVLPCPLVPQHCNSPKVTKDITTKKCRTPKSNVLPNIISKKSKATPQTLQGVNKKYTPSKIKNESMSKCLQPLSFISNDEIREKLSKFKIPKFSSPKVCADNFDGIKDHDERIDDSVQTSNTTEKCDNEIVDKREHNSQNDVEMNDHDSDNVTYNETYNVLSIHSNYNLPTESSPSKESTLNPQAKDDTIPSVIGKRKGPIDMQEITNKKIMLDDNDYKMHITNSETSPLPCEINKNEFATSNATLDKMTPVSDSYLKLPNIHPKYLDLLNYLAYINIIDIPEHLLKEICSILKFNLQEFLDINKDLKLLLLNEDEILCNNKSYNICIEMQNILQTMIETEGNIQNNLVMILTLLQNQLTDHEIIVSPPSPKYLQAICLHLIQVWHHAFQYQTILVNNLNNIATMFETLKELHQFEIMSKLTSFLLHFVDDNVPNDDLKMIVKLNCCKFNVLDFDSSESVIDNIINKTENEKIKYHGMLIKIALLCENNKNLDQVLQIYDEIIKLPLTKQQSNALNYFKAVAFCNHGQFSEAVIILKEISKDFNVNEVLHRNTLSILAIVSDNIDDVQIGLDMLDSYIQLLSNELGILHPKTLTYCHLKAKLIFKIPGRKTEALLDMWRIFMCQSQVLGEDHDLTLDTKNSIVKHAKMCTDNE